MPILPLASPLASATSSRTSAASRVLSDSAAMRSFAASSCPWVTTLVACQCSVSTSNARSVTLPVSAELSRATCSTNSAAFPPKTPRLRRRSRYQRISERGVLTLMSPCSFRTSTFTRRSEPSAHGMVSAKSHSATAASGRPSSRRHSAAFDRHAKTSFSACGHAREPCLVPPAAATAA